MKNHRAMQRSMKPVRQWWQEGKAEWEGGSQSGRVGAPWKALRIPRHWPFPEGSQALGIWDLSLVWVPAEGQDVMDSHSPSQENRQLWSCRETGVVAALLGEGIPWGASPRGEWVALGRQALLGRESYRTSG